MQADFVITLLYKYNESEYLNTILDFSAKPYEVCLQEIIFPSHAWQNFSEQCAEVTLGLFSENFSKSQTWKVMLPVRNYASNDDLVDTITRQMRSKDLVKEGFGPDDDIGIFRVTDKINTFKKAR